MSSAMRGCDRISVSAPVTMDRPTACGVTAPALVCAPRKADGETNAFAEDIHKQREARKDDGGGGGGASTTARGKEDDDGWKRKAIELDGWATAAQ